MRSSDRTDDPVERTSSGGLVRFSELPPGVLRDIALVLVADAVVGVSFGAISVAGGLPLWVPIAMSLLVYAGSAQFSAVALLTGGGGPVAAAATGLLLNSRTAAFSLAVADSLGRTWPARLVGAHLITDETAAFVIAQPDARSRKAAFWISGIGLFAVWNVSVCAGALAGSALGDTGRFGLDAAFPAVLLALVLPALRDDGNARRAGALGAVIALAATPVLPAGAPVLLALAGLVAIRRKSPDHPERPGSSS
ncbi:branched-chain amino acid ABC transporter permease [Streptomyces sp. p1417]|uniref:Branched-chain amino acid ABC transporter permease n=1 Tax=Streptomyces typhae TaxID=2681492 RepID=A0A6L6WV94_9ACTN|nr:AzlC family ABC transporter permease [Streptomyces typhae]MVO83861.1 branched-chain amino acid ABC transporter permease [Streptomyces typhae]